METEARTCLNDVLYAAGMLNEFTAGKTFSEYADNNTYVASAYSEWLYNCCHDRSDAQRPLLQSSSAASDE